MNPSIFIAAGAVFLLIVLIQFLLIFFSQSHFRITLERLILQEFKSQKEMIERNSNAVRSDLISGLSGFSETISKALSSIAEIQKSQNTSISQEIRYFTESNHRSIEMFRSAIENQLKNINEINEKKLEEMRKIVDEKLNDALEKRLGHSFKLVSTHLEAVQRGLGEMQNLAAGVGDLRRVLTNVKTRGIWGEVQLGNILEQILTPQQYDKNVRTKENSTENVEFAIRLPGRDSENPDSFIWLPIDSKFPMENYVRLLDYSESNDTTHLNEARSDLLVTVRKMAKEIRDKYIAPPQTTDFGILFLPIEGLYAEILKDPGLIEDLQQNFRIIVAGPATFSALLNSLKVGFRTLAIERRASEVWQLLSAVKTEFNRFGSVLDKVKKQLNSAARTIDDTESRTRAMERKLHDVELTSETAPTLLFKFTDSSNSVSTVDPP